jgi:hypothetical protein
MTHRINELALSHPGNTFCCPAQALAREPPIRLEFNHFDDRFSGRLFSTLPHQLPPRRNGGPSGRLYP